MSRFCFDLAVRKLMRQRRMKQTELARALGVSRRTVSDTICRGHPTVTTCEKYAAVLGVTLPELISEGYQSVQSDS